MFFFFFFFAIGISATCPSYSSLVRIPPNLDLNRTYTADQARRYCQQYNMEPASGTSFGGCGNQLVSDNQANYYRQNPSALMQTESPILCSKAHLEYKRKLYQWRKFPFTEYKAMRMHNSLWRNRQCDPVLCNVKSKSDKWLYRTHIVVIQPNFRNYCACVPVCLCACAPYSTNKLSLLASNQTWVLFRGDSHYHAMCAEQFIILIISWSLSLGGSLLSMCL